VPGDFCWVGACVKLTAVGAGESHTCALTTAGTVQCWGDNTLDQLGNGSTTTQSSVALPVTGLSGVKALAVGTQHNCVLTTAGGVLCWGYNSAGQLGNNSTANSLTPVAVSGLSSGVMSVVAGDNHTCALTTAGVVKCWGANNYGQIGSNGGGGSLVPVVVSGLASSVFSIAAGWSHNCALVSGGGIQCWGRNWFGELGTNTTTMGATPVPATVIGLSTGEYSVTGGDDHTCATQVGGLIQCWGSNSNGQLGNNSTTDAHTFVTLAGTSATSIVAGFEHTCALTSTGGIQCWGYNGYGQIGNNTTTDSHVPVAVSGITGGTISALAVGYWHTCALTTAGLVQCWGYNGWGNLGNGSTTDSHVPVTASEP
jgi:alpha-tubulin suppressor-like RCC1 family protein